MLKLLLMLLLGAASAACGFAALGATLYAHSTAVVWVAQCFGAFGFVAGLASGCLHLHAHGRPSQAPAALPPDELASLVRAALASAAAERQARPGSAADRRPVATGAPVPVPAPAPLPAPQPAPQPATPAATQAATRVADDVATTP